jgi:hypothetical protein
LGIILFAGERLKISLLIIPVLWCAISGATLWTLHAPDALVLPIAAFVVGALPVLRSRAAHSSWDIKKLSKGPASSWCYRRFFGEHFAQVERMKDAAPFFAGCKRREDGRLVGAAGLEPATPTVWR